MLYELDVFSMAPFSNFLAIVPDVPVEQFKEMLENAVSRVERGDGRFPQIAGFTMTWDPNGTAQVLDEAGRVVTPGTRIRGVQLADGTWLVLEWRRCGRRRTGARSDARLPRERR